ncbi:MAG: hypothetical protein LBH73_05290 [Spirochaetaceae bacterium]|nr:hypothetical protein [Spirochaetaceae bacterium]
MKGMRFSGALLLILSVMALGCAKEQRIKIGFNIPLTGDSPKIGEGAKFSAQLIEKEINDAGGLDVKGTNFKLVFIFVVNEL